MSQYLPKDELPSGLVVQSRPPPHYQYHHQQPQSSSRRRRRPSSQVPDEFSNNTWLLMTGLCLLVCGLFLLISELTGLGSAVYASLMDGGDPRANAPYKQRYGANVDEFIIEPLSWSPRLMLVRGFLTPGECEHLIELGKRRLAPSLVVDGASNVASEARSSSGTFLMHRTPTLERIEKRIAQLTNIPAENQEAAYLLRYEIGQQYKTHPDYFATNTEEARRMIESTGGQRVATVVMMLDNPIEGGQTAFPKADLAVKAAIGDALFWYNAQPNGATDPQSVHAGLPVARGTKWIATKWIRQRRFGQKKPDNLDE